MKTIITQINHPSELNALSVFSFARKRGLGTLKLSDSFKHNDKSNLERDLNKSYNACGCSTSSKLLLVGFFLGGLLYAFNTPFFKIDLPNPLLLITASSVVGAVLGKVIGLFKAQAKLTKTTHTIQALWRPETGGVKDSIICG